jgi:solute:Na+ symporter, SSS family
MSALDYIVILLFTLGVLVAGMSFGKSGKNMKTFFAGGGAVPWWINGLSLFMSFFSAGTFVAWGSLAYMHGVVSISIQWTMCLSGFAIAAFIAAKWRKTGVLTGSQFIGARLGSGVQKVYTYLFMAISVFTSGAFLYPVAKIVEGATGFPFEYVVIFLALVIVLYTATGGLWAVIVTDVLQFVVLSAAVLIIVPLAFAKSGGVSGFFENTPEGFFSLTTDEITPLFYLGFGIYNLCYIAGNWAYAQRFTSVKTPKDAKKVALLFGCLYAISPVIWMLPPMIYRIYNPSLDIAAGEANHAYMYMSKEVLPMGMLGLMLGAMVFATASSVNTTLNIVSGVFTNDIYRNLKTKTNDRELIHVARISTVVVGILAMVIALSVDRMGGILSVIWAVGAVTGGAMFIPMLWALFSKRHTGTTVLGATVICLIVNSFFKWSGVYALTQAQSQALGVLLPLGLMSVYEMFATVSKRISTQYLDYEEDRLVRERSDLDSESNREENAEAQKENLYGIKVIGLGVLLTGVLITLLGLFASTGVLLISVIGACVGMVGWLIYSRRLGAVREVNKN